MREGLLDDLMALREVLERRFNPSQPRDGDGQWTDGGMPGRRRRGGAFPAAIAEREFSVPGGRVTVTASPGSPGSSTLTVGGRSVTLSTDELRDLRRVIIDARYGETGRRSGDGVYRYSRPGNAFEGRQSEILVSLRPVAGRYVTESGRRVDSPDASPDEEVYADEFDMVLGEGRDTEFDDEPSIRVRHSDLDDQNRRGALAAAQDLADGASRVDTADGPVDVFPDADSVTLRTAGRGDPVEVSFSRREVRALDKAMDRVWDVEDEDKHTPSATVQTSHGPVTVSYDGEAFTVAPTEGDWGMELAGDDIGKFIDAFGKAGWAAGFVERSAIARYSPEQPRVEPGSTSGGQFAPADSGGKKKSSGSETLGYDPKTNRGTGYGTAGGDARVKRLQEALNRLGLTDQSGAPLKVDGKLGPKTTAAVKKLQRQLGLKADGQVTPALLERIAAMKGAKPAAKTSPRTGKATVKQKSSRLTEKPKATLSDKGSAKLQMRGGLDMLTTYDRTFPLDDIQIQRSGDGRTVEAYAAMFDAPYEVFDQHGHYLEQIDRSAFNRTLSGGRGTKAMCLYNHGMSVVDVGKPDSLAQVPLGTPLEIRPDGRGLLTVTRYNKSALADAVLESIRNGDVRSQSFRGRIVRSNPNGRVPRARYGQPLPTVTRHELGLTDYGPTPNPVNEGAEIMAVRSVQDLLHELADLPLDEKEELLRTLGLSTHNSDPDDEEEDGDEEDLDDDTATPDESGPGAEDPPAERSATHSGRLELKRALLVRALELRGVSRAKAA